VTPVLVVVQLAAFAGHYTQTLETKEYPVKHAVGVAAEAVQVEAPVAEHAAQTVAGEIIENPVEQVL